MTFNKIIFIGIALFIFSKGFCQYKYTDSLRNIIKYTQSDSVKIDALYLLIVEYQLNKPDSALLVAQELFRFSSEIVHRKLIQFCGVLSLLLLFEYITLFMHPFVAELTNHSPAIEIVIFVCVCCCIDCSCTS